MKLRMGLAGLTCLMALGSTVAKAQDTTALVEIAASLLADQFDVPSSSILSTSRTYGMPVYELAPVYAIRQRASSRTTVSRILYLRRQGMTWSQIANRVGLPPMVVRDLAVQGYLDSNTYWSNVAYRRYRIPKGQFIAVRRAGADWNQAFLSTQIARDLRTEPIYVYQSYRKNKSWKKVTLPKGRTVVYVPVKTSPLYRVWYPTRSATRALSIQKPAVRKTVKAKDGRKVDTRRAIAVTPRKTVKTSVVRNPAQTIRKRQVKSGGKVTTTVTHTKRTTSPNVKAKASAKAKANVRTTSKGKGKK